MSVRRKLDQLEKKARKRRGWQTVEPERHDVDLNEYMLYYYSGIELVEPQDTDPETYREIEYMRAVGRRDWREADRLQAPPPPPKDLSKAPPGLSEFDAYLYVCREERKQSINVGNLISLAVQNALRRTGAQVPIPRWERSPAAIVAAERKAQRG